MSVDTSVLLTLSLDQLRSLYVLATQELAASRDQLDLWRELTERQRREYYVDEYAVDRCVECVNSVATWTPIVDVLRSALASAERLGGVHVEG